MAPARRHHRGAAALHQLGRSAFLAGDGETVVFAADAAKDWVTQKTMRDVFGCAFLDS
jgi:hypothetical protein